MNRFFIEKINQVDKYIILDDSAQLHHLRDVLRIKPREKIAVFDNSGYEFVVLVLEIGQISAKLEIIEKILYNQSGIRITVACAIPKKAKMDDIIDKLTQLGVECVIPLETERVIIKLNKQKKIERLERWKSIALSAAKQSGRSKLSVVKPISELKDIIIGAHDYDLKLIPTLEGKRKKLKDIFSMSPTVATIKNILILIGPEGDFTPKEVSLAVEAGFLPISLGKQVLRVDTAAIAVVSFIKLNEEY